MEESKKKKKKKFTVRFEPSGLKIKVPAGTVLLEAAHKAGIYLSSICGGDGYCGKCKVIIDEGEFQSKPTAYFHPTKPVEMLFLHARTKVFPI